MLANPRDLLAGVERGGYTSGNLAARTANLIDLRPNMLQTLGSSWAPRAAWGAALLFLAWGAGMASQAGQRADDGQPQPDSEGFVALFDGTSLKGWEGDQSLWKVEEGAIVGDSPGIKQNEFLATTESFSDFELRLEFRLKDGKGNSGIQFRSRRVADSSEVSGYQADIGERYWGCLYDESRRNMVLAQAPDSLQNVLRKDGWNEYIIRAQGNRIELTLNGQKMVDYTEEDASIPRKGVLALQVHSGPPLRVEFRKIRIKPLTASQ